VGRFRTANLEMRVWQEFGQKKRHDLRGHRPGPGAKGVHPSSPARCGRLGSVPHRTLRLVVIWKGGHVAKLYRSSSDLQHWFVRLPRAGWARFPAKRGGWAERRPIKIHSHQHLNPVPLWLAFNTGLLESIEERALDRVA